MSVLDQHIQLLGFRGRDRVTGFEGVVSSIGFDLYGCVQVVLTPPSKDAAIPDGRWFDIARVEKMSAERVMDLPPFAQLASPQGVHQKGPADKPASSRW